MTGQGQVWNFSAPTMDNSWITCCQVSGTGSIFRSNFQLTHGYNDAFKFGLLGVRLIIDDAPVLDIVRYVTNSGTRPSNQYNSQSILNFNMYVSSDVFNHIASIPQVTNNLLPNGRMNYYVTLGLLQPIRFTNYFELQYRGYYSGNSNSQSLSTSTYYALF